MRAIDAPRVLEIGAFRGETTCVLAEAAASRGGYVVVIDPMRWTAEVSNNGLARHLPEALAARVRSLSSWLDRASYEQAFWRTLGPHASNVRLHRALSTDPTLLASPHPDLREFDVVFIDGDHGQAGAWSDLSRWATRTVRGGAILVHDAVPRFPGVLRALEDFRRAHDVVIDPARPTTRSPSFGFGRRSPPRPRWAPTAASPRPSRKPYADPPLGE